LVGLAAAMLAVLALVHRHPWLAALATVASVLGSPLAGLFAGIAAAVVLLTDRSRRREALSVGITAAGSLGVLGLLFHDPGVMPSSFGLLFVALIGIALVLIACREPTIRVGAVLIAVGLVFCIFVPNSVGQNLTRMVWLLAAPLIVGYGHRPQKHVVVLAGLALVYPASDVSWQLAEADSPAAQGSYYQPLLTQLDQRMYTAGTVGQRVEVVEPMTKGGAWHIGEHIPVARGWERQVDMADNPIFYKQGALTASSYHHWLKQLSVAYVALPNANLDFASVDEAALIKGGLPYLAEVWHNENWKLYRVLDSAPLARHAQVISVHGNQVRLQVPKPGLVPIQIRWSDHLVVLNGTQPVSLGVRAHGCLSQNGQWTLLHAHTPGSYVLTSDVDLLPSGPQGGGVCRSSES
ncbi:MAG: hypothetical protein J2P22_18325, partial [Nocardioides sp.]|nr:hypothetical protein [Nocardioides sp.]